MCSVCCWTALQTDRSWVCASEPRLVEVLNGQVSIRSIKSSLDDSESRQGCWSCLLRVLLWEQCCCSDKVEVVTSTSIWWSHELSFYWHWPSTSMTVRICMKDTLVRNVTVMWWPACFKSQKFGCEQWSESGSPTSLFSSSCQLSFSCLVGKLSSKSWMRIGMGMETTWSSPWLRWLLWLFC